MNKCLLGSIALVALSATTNVRAADIPVKTPPAAWAPAWTGFYAGISVGGRWSDTTWTTTALLDGALPVNPAGAPVTSFDSSTARVGAYIGYNWQIAPSWLFGIDGDVAWGNGKRTVPHIPGTTTANPSNDTAFVREGVDGSARGRFGFLITPAWLLYVAGGVAWQTVEIGVTCNGFVNTFCGAPGSAKAAWTKVGWTIGGGAEAILWGNWLARVEYRFADFGRINRVFVPDTFGNTITMNETLKTHTVLVGLAYQFTSPVYANY